MKPLALAVALAAAAPARAGDPVPPTLETVQIVGVAPLAGAGIDRRLLPYTVQTASSDAISASHGGNLADFLSRSLNGINVNDISGSPFQVDVTYRGFRASPVLGAAQGISVYLDGVRINEPFGDVVNWDMIPEAAIGSVLLVPGSNPVYGLNTLGGALALTGKSGLSHPGQELQLAASAAGQRRLDVARGGAGAGGWHSFAGLTVFDDNGWRDHSAGRLANLYARAGRNDAGGDWGVSLLAGRSRLRGNGLLPDAMAAGNRRAAYSHPDINRNELLQVTSNLTRRLGQSAELAMLAYVRSSRRDTVNGDVELDEGELEGELNTSRTRQRSHGASATLSGRRGPHRHDAGITFDRSTVAFAQFEQDGVLGADRGVVADDTAARESGSSVIGAARALGLFGSGTWRLGQATHLTASARFNHARVANTLTSARGPQAPESFRYTRFNPAIGIAHAAGTVTLVANITQGNRVPTVIELGCADPEQPCQLPVALQADPYLKQVVARTVEVGARWQRAALSGSVSLYRTVNRDDILFLSSGLTRLGYFTNFERTRHAGLDMAMAYAHGGLSWRASYNYLEAVYDAPGVLFTGLRTVAVTPGTSLAGLPRHTLKLGVQWRVRESLKVGADMHAQSRLATQGNEDGLLADPEPGRAPQQADLHIPGHALVSVHASWESGPHWEVYARVHNLLDRRYGSFGAVARNLFSAPGREGENSRFIAPGAPRSVTAGLRYRF